MGNSQIREEIKNNILEVLEKEQNGLNISQILMRIGKAKDDKTARSVIKEFENKLWKIEKQGIASVVILIDNSIW